MASNRVIKYAVKHQQLVERKQNFVPPDIVIVLGDRNDRELIESDPPIQPHSALPFDTYKAMVATTPARARTREIVGINPTPYQLGHPS